MFYYLCKIKSLKKNILIITLFISNVIYAQDPAYFSLGEDFFSNTDIYTLLYQESTDVLYVGTNRGLFAYKQSQFIKLKTPKEQLGSSLFQLKENEKSEVFCSNLSGQIFKVSNNNLELFYQVSSNKVASSFYYFFDENDNVIVSTHNTIIKIYKSGKEEELFNHLKQRKDSSDCKFYTVSQTLNKDIFFPISKTEIVLHLNKGVLDTISKSHQNRFPSVYFSHEKNIFSICVNGNINFNVRGNVIRKFDQNNNERLYQFNSNELIGLDGVKGLRILKFNEDSLVESNHFFDDLFVSACYQSKNGTLFLGSFREGIRIVPKKDQLQQSYEHLFLGIDVSPNNELFLTTQEREVFKYDLSLELVGESKTNIEKVFYINGDFNFDNIDQTNILYSSVKNPFNSIKDVCQIDDKTLLMSNYNGLNIITSDSVQPPKRLHYIKRISSSIYQIEKDKRISSVTYLKSNNSIYYATSFGVLCKDWASSKTDTLYVNNSVFIGNSLKTYNNQLICGTNEKGILFYNNNKISFQLTTKNGLNDNSIKKIKIKDNLLFILTAKGMQIYDLVLKKFHFIGIVEGVILERISNFTLSSDKLWLLEKNKFYSVPIQDILTEPLTTKNIYFDSITVNHLKMDYKTVSNFKNTDNAFSFYFDYRNIETKKETKIQYKLDGFTDWITISASENSVDFQYLPEGSYTFKLHALYRNVQSNEFSYSFTISPPLWKRWWFILLSLTIMFSLLMLIFWYRFNKLKKKNAQILKNKEYEKNAIDAQLKAIRAQMNPHFIFNSINSIQDLVLKQETIKSYDYLVEFSKLVRNTLDFSEREFIPLNEELDFLETYLSLEKLRFEDDFSFSVNLNINTPPNNIKIPSLIIQPFIENALKHGLLHKDGEKILSIEFSINKNIICKITDNGVGRTYSKTINNRQNKSHISFSTKAIQQRMAILNEQFGTNANYIIKDLINDAGEVIGTAVIVTLPLQLVN